MAYTNFNFPTKKALKEAVSAGKSVRVHQPNADIFGGDGSIPDGRVCIEGPHYPKPHSWYASVEVKSGLIVKVIG